MLGIQSRVLTIPFTNSGLPVYPHGIPGRNLEAGSEALHRPGTEGRMRGCGFLVPRMLYFASKGGQVAMVVVMRRSSNRHVVSGFRRKSGSWLQSHGPRLKHATAKAQHEDAGGESKCANERNL